MGKYGNYASLGNHDYWAGTDNVRPIIQECGITLVDNTTIDVPAGDSSITVTGTDAPWGRPKPHIPPDTDNLHIALSHTSDNVYPLAKAGVDFVFSGHLHGGQFRVPFISAPVVPSVYGRRFDRGHYVVNGTHLFLSTGLGCADPPVRIYCQPQIYVVDILPG